MTKAQIFWHKRVKSTRLTPTKSEIAEHFKDTDHCYICGCKVYSDVPRGYPEKKEIDHVIPLSKGGKHRLTNLAVCCSYCNKQKGNRLLSEMIDVGYDIEEDYMDWD